MFKHSQGKHVWTQQDAKKFIEGHPGHMQYSLLMDSLCVVDADDEETVNWLESLALSKFPDLSSCPCQATKKGRHYVFLRPYWADAEGYYDGARQVTGKNVDFKSKCSTGTRGVLAIAPSPDKK
jgi:hypothetical protein